MFHENKIIEIRGSYFMNWGNLLKIEFKENVKKVTLPYLVDFIWKNDDTVVCPFCDIM